MTAVRFQMAQNDVKTITNPGKITGIGGDNATEFFLFLERFPPGSQWVFPFTYGFLYIVDAPSYQGVKIDASQAPPGSSPPPATTKIAQLMAYDGTDLVFNPGVASGSGSIQRWNINAAPAVGTAATATKAGSTGVTHVGDSALFTLGTTAGPAVTALTFQIVDGATNLSTGVTAVQAIAGVFFAQSLGPLLTYRGTPGNAMTVSWTSNVASVAQRVSLSGYDQ